MTTASVFGSRKAWHESSPIPTIVALIVVLVTAAICFRTGFASLFAAWGKAEYSHGYIIPIIAIFIALLRHRNVPHAAEQSHQKTYFAGTFLVIIGVLAGAFGTLSAIPDIVTYGLIIGIIGVMTNFIGSRSALQLWPAWIYLLFMLPLPNFIYWPLSIRLQFLSSEIGVNLIQLMGIPVFLEGNIIDLGIYKLQVAEACSGLRYLFPLMSFGFLIATLFKGVWWQKLAVFLSTIPITIFMNSLRIAVIGILVNRYGNDQAEGFLHFFEGWVVFLVCISFLFAEAVLLMKLTPRISSSDGIFDLDFQSVGEEIKRFMARRATIAFFASTLVLLISATGWSFATVRPISTPPRNSFELFPMTQGGWTGRRQSLEPDIIQVLGADDYLLADFSKPGEQASVNLLISYYNSQTSGSGIHSPAVCIPAGGWEVYRWEQSKLSFGADQAVQFEVNRAVIQKGESKQLVYYWFEQRGRRLTGDYATKAYTVWDSAFKGRSDGALIRVVTSIDDNNVSASEDRLQHFLEITLPSLPKFVPP
jgi:exosortase D (VPLPA-CTERM-specific)